jgi:galactokinase
MTSPLDDSARAAFADAFGGAPTVLARAPGRVELLGNHTDYNGGLVLAAAIDRYTVVVGRPIEGREARVRSANLEQTIPSPWTPSSRVRGILGAVRPGRGLGPAGAVRPPGLGVRGGDGRRRPAGRGAVQLGQRAGGGGAVPEARRLVGREAAAPLDDPARMELAHLLRRSENAFVGVQSGLLDQFSTLFGRDDHALSLDCRSLDYERLPLGRPAPAIVVCDSKTSRRLADGMYNRRREECERVVAFFRGSRAPRRSGCSAT